jgi:hypothetical protein
MFAGCEKGASVLFDTDVLIWALRGNARAARVIENDAERAVSTVTVLELLQGVRDKQEMALLRRFVSAFDSIPLTPEAGFRAILCMEQHALRVDLSAVDALIAGTALECQLPLCTGNAKHFRAIDGLELRPFRP